MLKGTLHHAAVAGDASFTARVATPALANERDECDATPMHLAAFYGHAEVVTALIDADADLDAVDGHKRNAGHLAAAGGHR